MRDLYVRTSIGSGSFVKGGNVFSASDSYPESYKKWCDREFQIYIFSEPVDHRESESKLFPCRDLMGVISGTYIGQNRTDLRGIESDILDIFPSNERDIVFIYDFNILENKLDSIHFVTDYVYRLLRLEMSRHFGAYNIVAYMPAGGVHDTVASLGVSHWKTVKKNGEIEGYIIEG